MRKLYYMGLESYEARYTLQLTEWNRRVFDRRGLDVVYVPGTTIDNTQAISVGQVLDAHGRIDLLRPFKVRLVDVRRHDRGIVSELQLLIKEQLKNVVLILIIVRIYHH